MVYFWAYVSIMWMAGNPRVTPEVTRDVCLLARMMAANLYYSQIEDLMFEVCNVLSSLMFSLICLLNIFMVSSFAAPIVLFIYFCILLAVVNVALQ